MKKLTELDLQNVLDECELIKFRTHGDWLAGMVRRLNKLIEGSPDAITVPLINAKENSTQSVTIIKSGNVFEPESSCIK